MTLKKRSLLKKIKIFTINFGSQHPAAHSVLILVLELNIHKKTNRVVKKIKKNKTPSFFKLKFKFEKGIHHSLLTN